MKRGGPLRRRTPLRKKNPERIARLREKQFGPQAELCRTLPCSVPGCRMGPPCDPAHVLSRGAGGVDSDTIPLCRYHHDQQHRIGVRSFEKLHAIVLTEIARVLSDRVRYDSDDSNGGDHA